MFFSREGHAVRRAEPGLLGTDAYAFSIPASREFMSRLFMDVTSNIPHYLNGTLIYRTGSRSRSSFGDGMTLFFRQRLRKSSSRLCRRPRCAISTEAISSSTSMPTKSPTRSSRRFVDKDERSSSKEKSHAQTRNASNGRPRRP